ncbi:hypothetical protein DPX16_13683 [Anabarilius grahami]|uniref:Uncharacterized protein n=1 Tax=Anabarilius grahami TaxID=495550 RepID=A0A3N0XRP5_ANAGA|nr:hypothetical protein DPX16_13683 [Anabarilius grahami]
MLNSHLPGLQFPVSSCSEFVIEEVLDRSCNPRPVPPETQAAWPVRQSPFPSACPSSEHSPGVLPDPKTPMATEKPSAEPKRPRRRKKKAKQPQSPELSASVQPKPPEFSAAEPAPVTVGLLIEFEGMDWTPFPDPAPVLTEAAPTLAEPAPCSAEPAPSFSEAAPSFAEPAPAATAARLQTRHGRPRLQTRHGRPRPLTRHGRPRLQTCHDGPRT